MQLYDCYLKTKNKKCIEKFKNVSASDLHTLEDVKELPEYAGRLAQDTILIDIDDMEQSEILMNIVEDKQVDCRVYQTTRGRHFLFKNNGIEKCYTHTKCAIGLTMDVKVGCKNSYEVLKFDGKERFIEWDVEEGVEYQKLPRWLFPVSSNTDFIGMVDGDGRDSALYKYELPLQSAGLNQEECIEAINIINKYVIKDEMSKIDIERITRDEAFAKPVFFQKNTFMHNMFGDYLIRNYNIVKIEGKIHIYDEGIYTSDLSVISNVMRQLIPTIKKNQKTEAFDYLSDVAPNKTISDAELIAFNNGILNIQTGELLPFNPEYVITNKIPWNYVPDAYSELADQTLNKIACDDAEIRMLLEECIGYCFFRQNIIQKAFILVGEKQNGKSTFVKILNKILGDENVSALDLKNIGDRFSKATLYKKLANIGDDISDEFIPDPSLFKKIVSGDRIQAEFKGQTPFEFNPYCKLIFCANNMPRIKDKTGAVIRRLVIIPFDARFSEDDPDFDPYIENKLAQQDSIEYLIAIGIEGLKRILKNKKFTKSSKSKKQIDDYEEFNNPIIGFFKEQDEGYLFRNDTKTIYLAYSVYCNDNGFKAESQNMFGRSLKSIFGVESISKTVNRKRIRMYVKMHEIPNK